MKTVVPYVGLEAADWERVFVEDVIPRLSVADRRAVSEVSRAAYSACVAYTLRPYSPTSVSTAALPRTALRFMRQPEALRCLALRQAVGRLAPPEFRAPAWVGNDLDTPPPALARQAAYVAGLSPAERLAMMHKSAAHHAAGDAALLECLTAGSFTTPSRGDEEGVRALNVTAKLFVGDGSAFALEDTVEAWKTLQDWLSEAAQRAPGDRREYWWRPQTAHLHHLLCMLGHDPFQAWVDHEMFEAQVDLDENFLSPVEFVAIEDMLADLRTHQLKHVFAPTCVVGSARNRYPLPNKNGWSPRLLSPLCPSLTQLVTLSLASLRLPELPNSLSNLVHLQRVCLNDNLLDHIPDVATCWPQMTLLEMNHNRLDPINPFPVPLPSLQFLTLKANILFELPGDLTTLSRLHTLDVRHNECLESLPQFLLRELPALRRVYAPVACTNRRPEMRVGDVLVTAVRPARR